MDGLCHFVGPKIRCLDMDLMNLVKWVKENSTWIKANNGFVESLGLWQAQAAHICPVWTQIVTGERRWMQIDECAWCHAL